RHSKEIHSVVTCEVDTSASHNAGSAVRVGASDHVVWATPAVNNRARISIVTVQSLVASSAYRPYNHVVGAVGRRNERRADTALALSPRGRDGRWIGRSNAECGERAAVGAKYDIRALVGPIGGGCLDNRAPRNMQRGHRRADSAEVITINQIGVAIFAQGDNQVGRRGTGHVHDHWAGAAEISVTAVQRLPISRHPVIAGVAAKN